MARFVRKRLAKHLSLYFKDFDSKQVSLSFFKGEGTLDSLEMREEVFHSLLHLPPNVVITKAVCKTASAKIPWRKLKSEPIEFTIDHVDVYMREVTDPAEFVLPDEPPKLRPDDDDDEPGTGDADDARAKYGYSEKIVDGLRVKVNLMTINFDTLAPSGSGPGPILMLTLHDLAMYSTNSQWKIVPLSKSRLVGPDHTLLLFKEATCASLTAAVLPPSGSKAGGFEFTVLDVTFHVIIKRLVSGLRSFKIDILLNAIQTSLRQRDSVILSSLLNSMLGLYDRAAPLLADPHALDATRASKQQAAASPSGGALAFPSADDSTDGGSSWGGSSQDMEGWPDDDLDAAPESPASEFAAHDFGDPEIVVRVAVMSLVFLDETSSFANFVGESAVINIIPQPNGDGSPLRQLIVDAAFQSMLLHSASTATDAFPKHPEYRDLLAPRADANLGGQPMGSFRLVHRSFLDGVQRPDLSSELTASLRNVAIIYDRDEWVKFYYFWRPADWELSALDMDELRAKQSAKLNARLEVLAGRGSADGSLAPAPAAIPLKSNVHLVDPIIILPPLARCDASDEIRNMVARLNFSTIHVQNMPLKPPSRAFDAGLFSCPLYQFPAGLSDFDYGMVETGVGATRVRSGAYQVDMQGMWVELLAAHGQPPSAVIDPIPAQLDFFTYSNAGALPSGEIFLHVGSVACHLTHVQYLYFTSVYENRLAWDVSYYEAVRSTPSSVPSSPTPTSPNGVLESAQGASATGLDVNADLVADLVDTTSVRLAVYAELAVVELLDPELTIQAGARDSAGGDDASHSHTSSKDKSSKSKDKDKDKDKGRVKSRRRKSKGKSKTGTSQSTVVSCLQLSEVQAVLEHRHAERVIKACVTALNIAPDSSSFANTPMQLLDASSTSLPGPDAGPGDAVLQLRISHEAALRLATSPTATSVASGDDLEPLPPSGLIRLQNWNQSVDQAVLERTLNFLRLEKPVQVESPDAAPPADLRLVLASCSLALRSNTTGHTTELALPLLTIEPSFRPDSTFVSVGEASAAAGATTDDAADAANGALALTNQRLEAKTAECQAALAEVERLKAALANSQRDNDMLRADVHTLVEKVTELQIASLG